MASIERTYDGRTFEIYANVLLGAPGSYFEPDDPDEVDGYEVEEVAGEHGVEIEWADFEALLKRLFTTEGVAYELASIDEALIAVAHDDYALGGAHD